MRDEFRLRGHRPYGDGAARDGYAFQLAHLLQVDEMDGRHPQFHHGDQAVPAGNDARLVPVFGKDGERRREVGGPMIFKGRWYHVSSLSASKARSWKGR